ncbi:hypothetical protein HYY71_04260 [Candidatus Woesearchaeota archaeon]|nr:hypothetical protein [Candidatus Woesearchaeota archaeon]
MPKSRKSQSISINTIIIAAIALAVLVVLFLIFTGRFRIFSEGLETTASCYSSCNSVGLEYANPAHAETKCDQTKTYLPGTFKESKTGCCCERKP